MLRAHMRSVLSKPGGERSWRANLKVVGDPGKWVRAAGYVTDGTVGSSQRGRVIARPRHEGVCLPTGWWWESIPKGNF